MKILMTTLVSLLSVQLLATTYYWIANAPGSKQWADATDLNNWSTSWVDGYPDPNTHPTALPTENDEIWLCRDILMDLKGQTWKVKAHQLGVKYKLGGTGEYWGGDHPFAVTNGNISITGEVRMRSTGGFHAYNGSVLTLPGYPKPGCDMETPCPINAYAGGKVVLGTVQTYNTVMTVHENAEMDIGRIYPLDNATKPTIVENFGTITPTDGWTFRLYPNFGLKEEASMTLRQKAGVWTLKGNVDREVVSGKTTAKCEYAFELSGGTLVCAGNVAFGSDVKASMTEGAAAVVEVAESKTADFAGFTYGEKSVIEKTGMGMLMLSGAFPSELKVTAGEVLIGGGIAAELAFLKVASGATLRLGQTVHAETLTIEKGAAVSVESSALKVGAILVSSRDESALQDVAAAVNAGLDEGTGLMARVEDGAVVLRLAEEEDRNTIEVPADSVTLSAWIEAHGSPSSVLPLVKRGGGTLVIDRSTLDFTGGITIEEGAVKITNANQLCADGSMVDVKDGASLVVVPSAVNSMNFGTREIHLVGAGVDGKGALVDESSYDQKDDNGILTGVVVLEGDATIAATGGGRKDFGYWLKLNMNGHTLTVRRTDVGYLVRFGASTAFENPGHFVFDTCGVMFDGDLACFASGDGANTITMANGGVAEFWSASCTSCKWKMIWPNGGYPKLKSGTNNAYPGPVVFCSGTFYFQGTDGCAIDFSGKVTGGGTLNFNQHKFAIGLSSPENDFEGIVQGLNGDALRIAGTVAGVNGGGGTVSLVPFAGIYEGEIDVAESDETDWRKSLDAGELAISNRIVNSLKYFTTGSSSHNHQLMSYSGYLFVPGNATVVWNMHLCMNHYARLWIDGRCVISQNWWTDNKNVDVELAPGWHRFVLNSLATAAHGPSDANGTWLDGEGKACSDKGFAIKYSPGVGANSDEYAVPFDAGDGKVFSTVPEMRIGKLVPPASGVMDLAGQTLIVEELDGWCEFRNGNLVVDGEWIVPAAEFGVKTLQVDGTISFGATAKIVTRNGRVRILNDMAPLMSCGSGFVGELPMLAPAVPDSRLKIKLSADGKQLLAEGTGLMVSIR